LHKTIETILAEDPNAALVLVSNAHRRLWRAGPSRGRARDTRNASDGCYEENISPFPNSWCRGLVARLRWRYAEARAEFINAREEIEQIVRNQPDYAAALCALASLTLRWETG